MLNSMLVLGSLAVVVNGHAQLNSPAPFNTEPSKAAPCGGARNGPTTQLTVGPGDQLKFNWEVIAGDGVGPVTVSLDPNGGTNFQQTFQVSGATPTRVTKYDLQAAIPADLPACNPNTGCTLQFKSTSNWFACAKVKFQMPPTPKPTSLPTSKPTEQPTEKAKTRNPTTLPTTARPTARPTTKRPTPVPCVEATGLNYCANVVSGRVETPNGQTLQELDDIAKSLADQNLPNPLVFRQGNTTKCKDVYKKMICARTFKRCDGPMQTCKGDCDRVADACDTNPEHKGLYVCSDSDRYVEQDLLLGGDSTGKCVDFSTRRQIGAACTLSPRSTFLALTFAIFFAFW